MDRMRVRAVAGSSSSEREAAAMAPAMASSAMGEGRVWEEAAMEAAPAPTLLPATASGLTYPAEKAKRRERERKREREEEEGDERIGGPHDLFLNDKCVPYIIFNSTAT